jgi:hypothetical protein
MPATNLLPPGFPGRVTRNPLPGHEPATSDPAAARRLLAETGNLGFAINVPYRPKSPNSVAVSSVILRAWRAAGFTVAPVVGERRATFRPLRACTNWPAAREILLPLLSQTDDPYVRRRLREIRLLTLSAQPAAYDALDRDAQRRDFPVVVTGYGGVAMMRGSRIGGMRDDYLLGMPTWKDIWVR